MTIQDIQTVSTQLAKAIEGDFTIKLKAQRKKMKMTDADATAVEKMKTKRQMESNENNKQSIEALMKRAVYGMMTKTGQDNYDFGIIACDTIFKDGYLESEVKKCKNATVVSNFKALVDSGNATMNKVNLHNIHQQVYERIAAKTGKIKTFNPPGSSDTRNISQQVCR